MKKIISLCSVILVFALMITVFTACGDNTEENTTTQATEETIAAEGYSVLVGEASATVYKDGKEFQVLKYPLNSGVTVDLAYASKNKEFIDMNFDGVQDLYIAASNSNGIISYHCWLYNVTAEQFDYSVILSALQNISVDAENHRILSNSVVGGVEHVFSYRWVDGQLRFDTDYNEEDGGIPEDVTQVVADNAIGQVKPTENVVDVVDDTKVNKEDKTDKVDKNDKNDKVDKVDKVDKDDKNDKVDKVDKDDKADKEETTKKNSSSNKTTTKENKPVETTKSNKPAETTTKVNKPANTTTTAPNVNNGVVIETGSIDDGWF